MRERREARGERVGGRREEEERKEKEERTRKEERAKRVGMTE